MATVNPIVVGGSEAATYPVAYQGVSAGNETSASITATLSGVTAGHMVLAVLMHRSAVTPPAGWDVVASDAGGIKSEYVASQWVSIWSQTATSESVTFTASTASEGRWVLQLVETDSCDFQVEDMTTSDTMVAVTATGPGWWIVSCTNWSNGLTDFSSTPSAARLVSTAEVGSRCAIFSTPWAETLLSPDPAATEFQFSLLHLTV